MRILAYNRVSQAELDQIHYTKKTGAAYTLRQRDSLNVEMPFRGQGMSKTNSQGWLRDSNYYFSKLKAEHPEMISKKNALRIDSNEAPVVDAKMVKEIPEWEPYRGQSLIHHHVGGDGEAVAVPEDIHPGYGEIHNHEKAAGITDDCRAFSDYCNSREDAAGKTTSDLWEDYQATEENAEPEEKADDLTEGADESPAEENAEQEEQASDLAEGADESPAEENAEQEEQAADLTEGAEESPAEENTEQEEQAADLTEGAEESPAEENTEQEEQASDLAEGADETASEEESSEENQSYSY